ncbi:MAG TPA: MoaD/ThiS family protein [Cryptosporangiaceae bacterium]|nr:MoaD/ThiS family protein [Cryptosporangiaceae bacterium]
MTVGPARVVLPAALRPYAGGEAVVAVPLDDAVPLAEVLDTLGAVHPALIRRIRDERGILRRYVNVYVDGADVRGEGGIETRVTPGSEVMVLPSVAGG